MPNKILVSGLLNIETTVAVRGFPIHYYPIDYPFFGVNSHVSGVGFNIAKALTALGDGVDVFSFAGNDAEAARIFAELDACGISTENIQKTLKNTPASVILFDPFMMIRFSSSPTFSSFSGSAVGSSEYSSSGT